jgi:hypothetical protein
LVLQVEYLLLWTRRMPFQRLLRVPIFAAELRELLAIGHLVTTRKACTSDFLQTILAQVPELWAA